MSDNTHAPQKASLLSNILAIIGFIILCVIIIWGLVHVVGLSRGVFSSLFPKTTPTIIITSPIDTTSGTPTTISWKYTPTAQGSYAFLYQCQDGLQIQTISPNNTISTIPCGAAFRVLPMTTTQGNTVTVVPTSPRDTTTAVPFSIIFIPTTGTQVQGSASIAIRPGSVAVVAPTTPKPQTPVAQPTTRPVTHASHTKTTHKVTPSHTYSAPELAVRIIAIGIIDPITGAFVHRAPTYNDTGAVQFDIANVGGGRTGTWYFSAILPTNPSYTYESPAQQSLSSGDHILNTLQFTQVQNGGVFQVTTNTGKTARVSL